MRRSGAITIEFLMAFIISGFLIPLVYVSMRLLFQHHYFNQEAQDEIALYQLRKKLLLMDEFAMTQTTLQGKYYDEELQLTFKNNHLYLQPGTQIFLTELSDGYFTREENVYVFHYIRNNRWVSRVIASEK